MSKTMSVSEKMEAVEQVRQHIREQECSQQHLADKMGISQRSLSTWLLGHGLPTQNNVGKITRYFKSLTNVGNKDDASIADKLATIEAKLDRIIGWIES